MSESRPDRSAGKAALPLVTTLGSIRSMSNMSRLALIASLLVLAASRPAPADPDMRV